MDKLYKVLIDGRSCHGGDLTWSLPEPQADGSFLSGDWHRVEGDLELCSNGIHLCSWGQVWQTWMKSGAAVYETEADAEFISTEDKVVTRAARLLKPAELPDWWVKTQAEILAIQNVRWLQPWGTATGVEAVYGG